MKRYLAVVAYLCAVAYSQFRHATRDPAPEDWPDSYRHIPSVADAWSDT